MNIAFFNYYQSINQRGAETFLQELESELIKNNQTKIFQGAPKSIQNRSRLNILQRFYLDPSSILIALWTLTQIPALIAFKPKIILALNGGWQTLIIRVYCLLTGSKFVISAQSGPGWDDRVNLLFAPDIFVCLTKSQLDWAKNKAFHWPGQKFAVIPNGVDLSEFSPKGVVVKHNLPKPVILMVAALEPNKRVEQGIKAVAKLKNASLILLGKGPQQEKLNSLGKKLLPGRFLLLSVPHSEINKYYRAADIFTLCSESSEAFGIVYLEALGSNLPVVATDDPSRREIVGGAGIFVKNPDDTQEYAAALQLALKKDWKDLPRHHAINFSWDNIGRQYEETFKLL